MNTYLGACQDLGPADVDRATVEASSYVYLEGYLWDRDQAKEAFRSAAAIAHAAGNKVALTLSDSFCVDRYRDEFLELMRSGTLDILFANESELKSLYQTADFATALAALRDENNGDRRISVSSRARRRAASSSAMTRRSPSPPSRSMSWSTLRARETSSPPDSCLAFPVISMPPPAPATARSLPPRSSSTSAHVPP